MELKVGRALWEHDRIYFVSDRATRLRAIIALHHTGSGRTGGGIRFFPYPSIDEALHDYHDLLRIQRDGIAEVVNLKLNRVGGLTRARRLRDLCLMTGITLLIMDTGGTVLADTAVAHLA